MLTHWLNKSASNFKPYSNNIPFLSSYLININIIFYNNSAAAYLVLIPLTIRYHNSNPKPWLTFTRRPGATASNSLIN